MSITLSVIKAEYGGRTGHAMGDCFSRSSDLKGISMYQRILVPIDGSATSARGLQEAMAVAKLTHASLRLIHVVDEMPFALSSGSIVTWSGDMYTWLREAGEAILKEARAQVEEADIPVDTVLSDNLQGRVCDLVVDEAKRWKADLIVIGTHGRRGIARALLGSVAENVIRTVKVPVLTIHGPRD